MRKPDKTSRYRDWVNWHIAKAQKNPNRLIRADNDLAFFNLQQARQSTLLQIRRVHLYDYDDDENDKPIGFTWTVRQIVDGNPLELIKSFKRLSSCMKWLTKEIEL